MRALLPPCSTLHGACSCDASEGRVASLCGLRLRQLVGVSIGVGRRMSERCESEKFVLPALARARGRVRYQCDSAAPDYSIAEVLSGRLLLGVQGDGSLANGMHSPLTFSLNSEH